MLVGMDRVARPMRETPLVQTGLESLRRAWYLPALIGFNLFFWSAYYVTDWFHHGLFTGMGLDFSRFWGAAVAFRQSPASAYHLSTIATAMAPLARFSRLGAAGVHLGPSPYPPIFLAFFGLVATPSPPVGLLLWSLFNVAIAGIAAWQLARRFPPTRRPWIAAAVVLAFPLMMALFVGQVVAILLFCFTEGMLSIDDGHEFRAGLWFGLLTLKPQYLPLLLVFFLVKRRWWLLLGAAVSGAVLALASLVVGGVAGILAYVREILTIYPRFDGAVAIDPRLMINWRGLVLTILFFAPAIVGLLLVVALSLATLTVLPRLWRGPWDPLSSLFQWQILGTMVVTLLTAYHSESTGAAFLLVPGALILARGGATHLTRNFAAWFWLVPLVATTTGLFLGASVPMSLTMTALLIALLVTLLRHPPTEAEPHFAT